jgi:hypothetical protein
MALAQEEKSALHVAAQPRDMGKNSVQMILAHDLAGYGTNEIAQALDMTAGRISIIKGSPLYQEERARRWNLMKDQITSKVTDKIISDPAREVLATAREACARMKVSLALEGKSEFVRNAASSDVLAINGITPDRLRDKGSTVTVVIEEKMARRFGFAKEYQEPVSQELIHREIIVNATA